MLQDQDNNIVQFDDKNKGKELNEIKTIVHIMPKRFIKADVSSGNSKGVGILIMVAGFLLMSGIAVAVYYFLIKGGDFFNPQGAVVIEEKPVKKTTKKIIEEKPINALENSEDNNNQSDQIDGDADSNNVPKKVINSKIATSTDVINKDSQISTSTDADQASQNKPGGVLIEFKKAIDIDNDGLTDLEEVILGTDLSSMDTDGDGYTDKQEVLGLYNPAGDHDITNNVNLDIYLNSTYNYRIYYPISWLTSNIGGEESIMFKLDGGQFIQIIIQPNTKKETIEDWYKEQFSVDSISNDQFLKKKDWRGIRTEDSLTAYLTNPNADIIFTISYNLGTNNTLNYGSIFEMMINSLEIEK